MLALGQPTDSSIADEIVAMCELSVANFRSDRQSDPQGHYFLRSIHFLFHCRYINAWRTIADRTSD
jgi:hypothetical protein